MNYAIWYDNSSGHLEAFLIVEANGPEEAATKAYDNGLTRSVDVVVTEATQVENGFGNDPNHDKRCVLATAFGR